MGDPSFPPAMCIDVDVALGGSSHLSRTELLSRRSRLRKQLARLYESHFWTLLEDLPNKHTEYYWTYGKTPFKADHSSNGDVSEKFGEQTGTLGIKKCAARGCKKKAMALTSYCHPHILQDSKQVLYKACTFVIKSVKGQPKLCRKAVLRSIVPALCPVHFEKAEKHVEGASKCFGLNVSSQSKLAPSCMSSSLN